MKKVFLTTLWFAFLVACGSNSSSDNAAPAEAEKTAEPETTDITADPNYQKGLDVIAKSDCNTCHEINEKKTGPSFHEIAVKYANADEAMIDTLAEKIIKGGTGHWGTAVMQPHPTLSKEEAKTAVRYVLLMKNQ